MGLFNRFFKKNFSSSSINNKNLFKKANDLFQNSEYEESLSIYKRLLKDNFEKVEVLNMMFNIYRILEDYDKCLKCLDCALNINPTSFRELNLKGEILIRLGQYKDSIKFLNQAIDTDNEDINKSKLMKANALIELGDYDDAKNILDNLQFNKYESSDGSLWIIKGNNYALLEDFEEAIICYQNSINLNYNLYGSYFNLGNCFYNLKKYKNALNSYNEALKFGVPNDIIFYNKGVILALMNFYDQSLIEFDKALKLNPNDSKILINKANSLFMLNKFEDALCTYNEVLKLDSNNINLIENIIITLEKLNRFDEVLDYSDYILKIDNNHFNGLFSKANALKGLKRYDEALICYDKALSVKEDEDVIREKEELLLLMEG